MSYILLLLLDMLLICSPCLPATHYVEQMGLKLTEVHLPLPLSAKVEGMLPKGPKSYYFLAYFYMDDVTLF